jgi:transposase
MQKALTQMNLQLHTVITDLTGSTGLNIVRSILAGVHDPEQLAAHRDPRCKAAEAELVAALTGNYRAEHLFSLRQNFAAYEFHLGQIAECAAAVEALLQNLAAQQPSPSSALPPPRRKRTANHHAPHFDIRTPLHRLTGGADLSQIDAIGPQAALQLVAEIGTDMSRWRTAQHFTSWLTLAPNNKISGGRLLSSRTPPSANRAAAVLRRCAMSLTRARTALGAFYHRLAVRIGKPRAITATARKLALLVVKTAAFGRAMVSRRDEAMVETAPIMTMIGVALQAAVDDERSEALLVIRASLKRQVSALPMSTFGSIHRNYIMQCGDRWTLRRAERSG